MTDASDPVRVRRARRAFQPHPRWGLPEEDWSKIDEFLDALDPWEDEETRDIAEMILVGLEVGTDADKVARITGLNRDKFVRPRAKLLRDNGIWSQGKTKLSQEAFDNPDKYLGMEIILMVLAAKGLIQRSDGVKNPDE